MRLLTVMAAAASTATGLDPAWIALLGAMFGGAGLKITEAWLGRNRVRVDDATIIRNELRTDMTTLRTEMNEVEAERDQWRDKYYAAQDKIMALKGFIISKGHVPPE